MSIYKLLEQQRTSTTSFLNDLGPEMDRIAEEHHIEGTLQGWSWRIDNDEVVTILVFEHALIECTFDDEDDRKLVEMTDRPIHRFDE